LSPKRNGSIAAVEDKLGQPWRRRSSIAGEDVYELVELVAGRHRISTGINTL